jgi:hypothetical protein
MKKRDGIMEEFLAVAEHNLRRAREVIAELGVEEAWKSVGGTANLVGSVRTGLLMSNLDIDFHVYSGESENPTAESQMADGFAAMAKIASRKGVHKIECYNFLGEEDRSFDWHLFFVDAEERTWKIDIIHIMNDSAYKGKFERVADRIQAALTPEFRKSILKIKWDGMQRGVQVVGIEVYKAVIEDAVRTFDEFQAWKAEAACDRILQWEPGATV